MALSSESPSVAVAPARDWRPWAWSLGLALVALALVAPPLFQSRLLYAHDLNHIPRVAFAHDALEHGMLSWRWLPAMARGYGYPLFSFYAPASVWLSVLLWELTGRFVLAHNLTVLCIMALGWAAMWLWVRARWSAFEAGPAALLYTLAPYHLLNTHVRGAMAEALALAIFPAVLWAIERALQSRRKTWIALAGLLWALLVLSHNLSALILSVLALAYFGLTSLWERRAVPAVAGFGAFGLGVGLSAFFWLPAIAELGATQIEWATVDYFQYYNHFVHFHQFFQTSWEWGASVPGPDDSMSFQIGWVHVAVLLLSLTPCVFFRSRLAVRDRFWTAFWQIAALAAVWLMMESSAAVWRAVPPLQMLQFPWRLLGIVTLAASVLIAPILRTTPGVFRWPTAGGIVLLALVAYQPYTQPTYVRETANAFERALSIPLLQANPEFFLSTGTSMQEYLPRTVREIPPKPPAAEYVAPPGLAVTGYTHRKNTYRFSARASAPGRLVINQFHFPAWRATIGGRRVPLHAVPPYGTIGIDVPAGESRVELWFGSTPWRTAGRVVSALTLLGILAVLGGGRLRRERRPETAPAANAAPEEPGIPAHPTS